MRIIRIFQSLYKPDKSALVSSPDKQYNKMSILVYGKDIYFKELAHEIMEEEKSKICSVSWESGVSERAGVADKSEITLLENSLLLSRGWSSFMQVFN